MQIEEVLSQAPAGAAGVLAPPEAEGEGFPAILAALNPQGREDRAPEVPDDAFPPVAAADLMCCLLFGDLVGTDGAAAPHAGQEGDPGAHGEPVLPQPAGRRPEAGGGAPAPGQVVPADTGAAAPAPRLAQELPPQQVAGERQALPAPDRVAIDPGFVNADGSSETPREAGGLPEAGRPAARPEMQAPLLQVETALPAEGTEPREAEGRASDVEADPLGGAPLPEEGAGETREASRPDAPELRAGDDDRLEEIVTAQAARGGGRMRVKLHPPELGEMEVEVTVRGGRVGVRFHVESSPAQTLLTGELSSLREALQGRGFSVARAEVYLAGDGSSAPGGGGAWGGAGGSWEEGEAEAEAPAAALVGALDIEV